MKRILLLYALVTTVMAATAQTIPLKAGKTWVFNMQVERQKEGGKNDTLSFVTSMRILKVVQKSNYTVALVMGSPNNFPFSDIKKAAKARSLLIKTPKGKYYLESLPADQNLLLDTLTVTTIKEHMESGDAIFKEGIKTGETVCNESEKNCEPTYHYTCSGKTTGKPAEYQMTFTSAPDGMEWTIVSGTGFTKYTYTHHGSVENVTATLVK